MAKVGKNLLVFLGVCVFSMGVISSCGKKNLPLPTPPEKKMEIIPPAIDKAKVTPTGVIIKWKYPPVGDKQYPFCFVVQKADIPWKGLKCVACPELPWTESRCISPDYPYPAVKVKHELILKDENVSSHHAYRYRIVVYDVDKRRPLAYGPPLDVKVFELPPKIEKASARATKEGILLSWFILGKEAKSVVKNGISFAIERRTPGTKWHRIDTGKYRESTFLDGEVKPGKIYEYRVIPYYSVGGIGIWGKPYFIGKVRAEDRVLPPPPKTVWVVPSRKGLEVHWLEVSVPVGGYYVYRKDPDGTIIRLTQTPLLHPPFIDTQVKKNEVYSYAVSSASPNPPYREGLVSSWVEIRNVFFK